MNAFISLFLLALCAQVGFGFPNFEIKQLVNINANEFPYLVSVTSHEEPINDYICGGTIIDELHILTSATCAEYFVTFKNAHICAGSKSWGIYENCTGTVDNVVEAIIRPGYSRDRPEGNVAVLKLERPLSFSENLNKAELVDESFKEEVGSIARGGELIVFDDEIKNFGFKILSAEECSKFFKGDDTFCAQCLDRNCNPQLITDLSGSPLVQNGKIIGWNVEIDMSTDPSLFQFTRVSQYRDFIDNAIKS